MERNNIIKNVGIFGGGLAVGGVLGYFTAIRRMEKHYIGIVERELAEIKDYYSVDKVVGSFDDVQELMTVNVPADEPSPEGMGLDEYESKLSSNGYSVTTPEEPVKKNVFEDPDIQKMTEEMDGEEEEGYDFPEPDPDAPYIISVEEFLSSGDPEYDKLSVTYFEDDDTLADEREQIIPEIDSFIGEKNLIWGVSDPKDKDVVFIRNQRLSSDIEVTRHEGSYANAVLGISEATLNESESWKRPKKKLDDD